MEKMILHKNKGEVIKCQLEVDGADLDKIFVRMCMEFEDGKNLYFNGQVEESGECSIKIPRLNEMSDKKGKCFIEAIADNVYFRLYESLIEIKNSVEVKMKDIQGIKTEGQKDSGQIAISNIKREEVKEEEKKEVKVNPYLTKEKPVIVENKPIAEKPVAENKSEPKKNNLMSIWDFRKKH